MIYMSKYALYLTNNNAGTLELPLLAKGNDSVLQDYYEKANDRFVYNDYFYHMHVILKKLK